MGRTGTSYLSGDVPNFRASQVGSIRSRMHDSPPGKQRPAKKSKSDATASTGGSSASAQFGELMEQELRLKREAAERAFALKRKRPHLMRLGGVRRAARCYLLLCLAVEGFMVLVVGVYADVGADLAPKNDVAKFTIPRPLSNLDL
ncbi:hypothetical protein Tco_1112110 [Tanacetum coccineum]|uniref:Uncharacterized protein n=1 Tax=Tanacetum coccineum TaxID=301880 RepID=A0ABQ5IQR6_9ASTR